PVFCLIPDGGCPQALFDTIRKLRFRAGQVVDPQAIGNIVEYRSREWVRFLEHHAHSAPEQDYVHTWSVDVFAVQFDATLDSHAGYHVIHSIQRTDEGGFSAARWSDESSDQVGCNVERYRLQGQRLPIIEVQSPNAHLDRSLDRFGRCLADQE